MSSIKDVVFKIVSGKNHESLKIIRGLLEKQSIPCCYNSSGFPFLEAYIGDGLEMTIFDGVLRFKSTEEGPYCPILVLSKIGLTLRTGRHEVAISSFFAHDFPFFEEEGYELLSASYPELDTSILRDVANLELESRRKYDLVG